MTALTSENIKGQAGRALALKRVAQGPAIPPSARARGVLRVPMPASGRFSGVIGFGDGHEGHVCSAAEIDALAAACPSPAQHGTTGASGSLSGLSVRQPWAARSPSAAQRWAPPR